MPFGTRAVGRLGASLSFFAMRQIFASRELLMRRNAEFARVAPYSGQAGRGKGYRTRKTARDRRRRVSTTAAIHTVDLSPRGENL
jgi:hypothetical protein